MSNYMIHAVPKRLWYVENFLIPSMQKQGCGNITVYVDKNYDGNLRSCINSFLMLPDNDEGTWHIQDDTVVCKDFKEKTELNDKGIVCGFSSDMYDGERPVGEVEQKEMWFSFPCIRIPNQIARNCAQWLGRYIVGNMVYRDYWINGRNDDWAFRFYLKNFHKDMKAVNLAPNLVDHIDYLIGGSANARNRPKPCRSQYWQDEEIVEKLKEELKGWVV